jgi:hypothetical protein
MKYQFEDRLGFARALGLGKAAVFDRGGVKRLEGG